MLVLNRTRHRILGEHVRTAGSALARMRGLLGTATLHEGRGLWIAPCGWIHSFGMRYEFDALFIDTSMKVVAAVSRFPRNRFSRAHPSARGVLELPAGMIESTGTRAGDEIAFVNAPFTAS